MKIETPQILWHSDSEGNGKPAPLYSISLLPTTDRSTSTIDTSDTEILATAGNSNELHIWKLKLSSKHESTKKDEHEPQMKKPKIFSLGSPGITHLTTLTRHDRSINSVEFSPRGTHLVSAGDGGTLIVHSVPLNQRSNNNSTFWKALLQSEKDLSIRLVHTGAEDVMDISWSQDDKRFMIGTLDHSVLVFEEHVVENESKWNCVWKSTKEHTHYVQGVSYDPLGVYIASQGSDRSVRVWQRKNSKKNGDKKKIVSTDGTDGTDGTTDNDGNAQKTIEQELKGKFDVGKAKILKYRSTEENSENEALSSVNANGAASKKRYLYADESTVESFFRRLSWTSDGAFLVTPASLWHKTALGSNGEEAAPTFATYLFARHEYEKPYKVLHGLEKPSVVIRPNPLLFKLPKSASEDSKENLRNPLSQSSPAAVANNNSRCCDESLPYRSIFAVLTLDSIIIYDTYHSKPLCVARGLHLAGLTDCSWTAGGKHLVVSSTDGYISFISFLDGELGEIYEAGEIETMVTNTTVDDTEMPTVQKSNVTSLPPCEPGLSAIVAPPTKKAKINNDGVRSNTNILQGRKKSEKVEKEVVGGVTNLSLNNSVIEMA
jgi:chromatin assembly factor 1 subunit B